MRWEASIQVPINQLMLPALDKLGVPPRVLERFYDFYWPNQMNHWFGREAAHAIACAILLEHPNIEVVKIDYLRRASCAVVHYTHDFNPDLLEQTWPDFRSMAIAYRIFARELSAQTREVVKCTIESALSKYISAKFLAFRQLDIDGIDLAELPLIGRILLLLGAQQPNAIIEFYYYMSGYDYAVLGREDFAEVLANAKRAARQEA